MRKPKVYNNFIPLLSLKYSPTQYEKVRIIESKTLFDTFLPLFDSDTIDYREETHVLYMNSSNTTVAASKHTSGSTNSTIIDPKIILTEALLCGAHCIAIAHNHHGGIMSPSKEDIHITKRINEACNSIGIRLIDHIILTTDTYYSFTDEGML